MSDSEDPRTALTNGDVTARAAAARELARIGTWKDLAVLVDMAKSDKSPSVRLYTAAAASDIVARKRGAAGQKKMTRKQADEVQDWVKSFDPGINPSLLMMLSAVADAASIKRLGLMLRDPRNGVRSGAATALRRMAVSSAAMGDEALAVAAGEWLRAKKLPPDSILELLRIAGQVGWTGLDAELRIAAGAGRNHVPAFDEVLQRQAARLDPTSWDGLWASDGADALCSPEREDIVAWVLVSDGKAWNKAGAMGDIQVDGVAHIGGVVHRRIWCGRVGSPETFEAIQGAGETFYRVDGKALAVAVDALYDELGEAAIPVAGWLDEVDGAAAVRGRAVALWAGGDLQGSLEILDGLTSAKKPRNDLYYWQARVKADLKDAKGALEALDSFLLKAAKRAPYRQHAEELRASLS